MIGIKRQINGVAAALLTAPLTAFGADGAFAGPMIAGIPVEFVLFGIVLLGVALFHHHTFPIAWRIQSALAGR
jgi:hypothetical protein